MASRSEPPTSAASIGRSLSRRAIWFLLLGIAVREGLSFWTGHPYDLESFLRTGYVVAHGGSPYVAAGNPVPGASFAYLGQGLPLASYPPFWPETLGGVFRLWESVGQGNRFVLYGLIKQPAIACDALVAFLLARLARTWGAEQRTADRLVGFWSLFPYSIAITAVWGQFDAIVVALLLVAIGVRSSVGRNVVYGFGALAKWITVIFVPYEFARNRGWRRLSVLAVPAVLVGVGVWPFLLQGWSLPQFSTVAVYEAHGDNLGMNYVYLLTSGGWPSSLGNVPHLYAALGFLWVPAAIASGWVAARWVQSGAPAAEVRAVLLVLSSVLLVRWGLYEQYFLYLFAWMALDVAVFHPGRRGLLLTTIVVASAQLLANNDLGLRFATPSDPALFNVLLQGEAGSSWGPLRGATLLVLSVVMTATLIQLVYTIAKDDPAPSPWWMWPFRHLRAVVAGRSNAEEPLVR